MRAYGLFFLLSSNRRLQMNKKENDKLKKQCWMAMNASDPFAETGSSIDSRYKAGE